MDTMTVTGTNRTSALICQWPPFTNNIVIDIEQSVTNLCVHATNATLNLTASSWWPEGHGTVLWSGEPAGLGGETASPDGRTYTFDPQQSTPDEYSVTARYSLLPEIQDTCVVRITEVDFEARYGRINYGFDPKETVRTGGPHAWASVDKDGTSDVPKIKIEPTAVADQIELVIVAGAGSADINPKTFNAGSTDVIINGQGTAGNALVEA